MSKHQFQTEVSQLLQLIIHSLYSHKEIFLRELISNASDALDKYKYLTLTDDQFKTDAFNPEIHLFFDDEKKKTLTIADNGIGMNEQDLLENLGTIARSGTKNFLSQLSGDEKKDSNLIGQFGVGFYSVFMVAKSVEVITKKAGEEKAYKWVSEGSGEFDISEAERDHQGTTIILHLNEEGEEFANRWQIEQLIKKYSDHLAFPIILHYDQVSYEGEGDDKKEKREAKQDQVNAASAMWRRNKSDLSEEDYYEFYKTFSHDNEDPMFYVHTKAEGTQEYTTLFYIPKTAPFDMNYADYKPGVKLYVKRVFIMDDSKELLPTYLRFVRGIIDSEDLPLNVSREILQQNRVLQSITTASVKKLLGEFKKLSESNPDSYDEFIAQFNRPLKEGLYSDFANKEALTELVRFHTTAKDGYTSFASYVERMPEDQKVIYYITGDNLEAIKRSPLLEAYKKKDIEVLLMADDIDEIVIPGLMKYKDYELKAVNRSDAAEDLKDESDEKREKEVKPLIEKIKKALGDRVKDVIVSHRLVEAPSCIVVDQNDPTVQLQHMMKSMGQAAPDFTPILEVNPDHEIVKRLEGANKDLIADVSSILLDQAMLLEGAELKDPSDFVTRLNRVLSTTL
jgi:molecular chaperone HtpG